MLCLIRYARTLPHSHTAPRLLRLLRLVTADVTLPLQERSMFMRVVRVLRLRRPLAGGEELDDGPHRTSGSFCLPDPDAFLTSDLTPGSLQKANVYVGPDDLTACT